MNIRDWKLAHLPPTGICLSCGKNRGSDLAKWTLIEGYMCCKWCFQRDVGDKSEQQRIVEAFHEKLHDLEAPGKTQAEKINEIWELLMMQHQMQITNTVLTTQFLRFDNVTACELFVRKLLTITDAPEQLGRYLIGHELKAKWGNRLEHLISVMPSTLIKDLNGVLVTPGILTRRNELLTRDEQPAWLVRAMAPYTTDPTLYSMYSVVYVKALLENPE